MHAKYRAKNLGRLRLIASGLLVAALPAVGRAAPIVIGPNVFTDTTTDNQDTSRLNIAVGSPVTLGAGTYTINGGQYNIGAANTDVQPFLAVVTSGTAGSGNETYKIIAVANDTTFASTGVQTVTYNTPFTLTGSTTVYAGITNVSTPNGVTTDAGGVATTGNTAHFNPGGPVTVGQTVAEYAATNPAAGNGSSNGSGAGNPGNTAAYELSRHYDFAVTVNSAVPEPTALGSVALGGVGLMARRRRRN